MEYPKTENLYARDPENPKLVGPEYGFRQPEVALISKWLVTEKVDGMNMRVEYYPFGINDSLGDPEVFIYGRTVKAQIPGDLLAHMQERFTPETLAASFEFDPEKAEMDYAYHTKAVIFGEGFGPGIQKAGHAYGGEKRFILFDVVIGETWLTWDSVTDIAAKLGVPTVPVLCRECDLHEAKFQVLHSKLLDDPAYIEGIVARTDPYLFDRFGRRVGFKYKVRDL